jgi:hypothetical protein
MRAIIKEIRNQPHHVRELATVLCTIVVVAIVGIVWFHSFQHDIYAMLNPTDAPQAQDQMFAQQSTSLFGSMFQALKNSSAEISNFFSGKGSQTNIVNTQTYQTNSPSTATHPLPVSGGR